MQIFHTSQACGDKTFINDTIETNKSVAGGFDGRAELQNKNLRKNKMEHIPLLVAEFNRNEAVAVVSAIKTDNHYCGF